MCDERGCGRGHSTKMHRHWTVTFHGRRADASAPCRGRLDTGGEQFVATDTTLPVRPERREIEGRCVAPMRNEPTSYEIDAVMDRANLEFRGRVQGAVERWHQRRVWGLLIQAYSDRGVRVCEL